MFAVPEEFGDAVVGAAGRGEVVRAVREIYAELEGEIEQRRPKCVVSGRCCRFEEFGHRLFVTTAEMGAFLASRQETTSAGTWDGRGCPFQVGKLCGVHGDRPFGCRIYFCDETSTEWQRERYEAFHGRLKELHEAMGVPYYYVEWRTALGAVGLLPEVGVAG